MGVNYYTCDNCGENFPDSGTYIQCEHGHYLGPCCFPLMEGCKHMRLDYWIQDQTIETDEYGDAVMEAFCPVCAKGGSERQRLEDAEKMIQELGTLLLTANSIISCIEFSDVSIGPTLQNVLDTWSDRYRDVTDKLEDRP